VPADKSYVPTAVTVMGIVAYNKSKVKNPPTTWQSLLSSTWKGQVGMDDPSQSGPTFPLIAGVMNNLGGVSAGEKRAGPPRPGRGPGTGRRPRRFPRLPRSRRPRPDLVLDRRDRPVSVPASDETADDNLTRAPLQERLQPLPLPGAVADQLQPRAGQVPQRLDLRRRHERRPQQPHLRQPGDPLRVEPVRLRPAGQLPGMR
jgi:Bacterial extracellular solute-binding protein